MCTSTNATFSYLIALNVCIVKVFQQDCLLCCGLMRHRNTNVGCILHRSPRYSFSPFSTSPTLVVFPPTVGQIVDLRAIGRLLGASSLLLWIPHCSDSMPISFNIRCSLRLRIRSLKSSNSFLYGTDNSERICHDYLLK